MPAQIVRERPILFSGPMVQAILEECKTQTRRVVRYTEKKWGHGEDWIQDDGRWYVTDDRGASLLSPVEYLGCPYGAAGGRLWVRETWGRMAWHEIGQHVYGDGPIPDRTEIVYKAGQHPFGRDHPHGWDPKRNKWKPSIHMPRKACRILLEVTEVRVERVQEITEPDCFSEGIPESARADFINDKGFIREDWPNAAFRKLWDSINEKRGFSWSSNPWVWVLSFKWLKP